MTKNVAIKVVTLVALCIFILALGVSSFAKIKEPDSINWSYIITCDYNFDLVKTDNNYKYFDFYATTTTGAPRYAYAKIELQRLSGSGWSTIDSWSDEDYMAAGVEELSYPVAKNYTYRLKLTHQAKTSSGTVLETFSQNSYTL